MVSEQFIDRQIRLKVFDWLLKQVDLHGDVLPRKILEQGIYFKDIRITLVGPTGIWKPKAISEIPISITTTSSGPYDDTFSDDGLLLYKYRGNDPRHRDNVGLRKAMQGKVPLVYFHSIVKGRYLAVWPVYIVGDNPDRLTFTVAVDDVRFVNSDVEQDWDTFRAAESGVDEARREYVTSLTKIRLHQRSFRERVLKAYHEQCSLCRLKHRELLEAAHIIPDGEPDGKPIVPNGISLCILHHKAFDKNFLGISPDYKIVIREDVLRETDGPMLQHGLQELHGQTIIVPNEVELRPDRELLALRFKKFRKAM